MTYPEAIQYLESFINYEKIPVWSYRQSLKLERIKNFLSTIGNPQDNLQCIHIAGSKGKGSTCAFIAYILREAGYKVGLYTSPHLSDFRERIRILWHRVPSPSGTRYPISCVDGTRLAAQTVQDEFEGMISKDELTGLVKRLKPDIEKYNKDSEYGPLSFFEVYTALAFLYFKEKKVDLVVLETGLGGRLDATNVVKPYVCAITPISYEHTQKLGNTLKEIATEKVGIIKKQNLIVVSAPQKKEVMQVIRNRCKESGASFYEVNKGIDYKIRLLGEHQLINAAVAVAAVRGLACYSIKVSVEAIKRGLYHTVWPGRCEAISKNPLVVLDGAQNIASSRVLKETIKDNFKYKRLIIVLGVSTDKDIKGICNELYDLADEVVLTKADNPRAQDPQSLARYFKGKSTHLTESVNEAKEFSKRIARQEDLILVTGSLFVVGEFRRDCPRRGLSLQSNVN